MDDINAPFPANAPETSAQAAGAIEKDSTRLRRLVMGHIMACGEAGATDEEIQMALALSGNTERPRRWELEKLEQIRDSGKRRKTASGRNAVVWVARNDAHP